MGPGVPGLGIASIFYVGAALLGPLRELVRTLQGRSSPERRRLAYRQAILAIWIVIAVVSFYLGLAYLVRRGILAAGRGPSLLGDAPNWVYAAIALIAVLAAASAWAIWARLTYQEEHPDAIAAAHRLGVLDPRDLVIDLTDATRTWPSTEPVMWQAQEAVASAVNRIANVPIGAEAAERKTAA